MYIWYGLYSRECGDSIQREYSQIRPTHVVSVVYHDPTDIVESRVSERIRHLDLKGVLVKRLGISQWHVYTCDHTQILNAH